MQRIILLIVFALSLTPVWSQPWLKYLKVSKGQEPNFYQIQEAFYNWEKTNNILEQIKDHGEEEGEIENWMLFKRWEYIWEGRADAQGQFLNPWNIYQQTITYRQTHKINYNSGDWSLIGPSHLPKQRTGQPNGLGRINAVVFDPTDTMTFYVCTASGGLWRTRDYGQSWEYLSVALPTLGTSDALVDPMNPDILYLATGDRDAYDAKGLGIWKTTDGGKSWRRILDSNMTVNMLLMDPNNHQKIIAGATFGIYVTTDGGHSWTQTLADVRVKDLEFHPTNPNIIYATGQGLLFKSTDGGQTWTDITSRLNLPVAATRNVIGVSPAEPDWLYVLATDDNGDVSSPFLGLYLSRDGGETFTLQTSWPNILGYQSDGSDDGSQAWYDLAIAVDPSDANIVYTGGVNVWKSTDAGATFKINAHWVGSGAPAIHADQHDLRFSNSGKTLFACNDGGIYYTPDGGKSWSNITSGLSISQVYRIGASASDPLLFLNGYQDNGTALSEGIDDFTTVIGGDGMECLIDYSSDDYMFGELYYGDIRRSVRGSGFKSIIGNIGEQGYWVTPYVQNPRNPDELIVGFENVWRTKDVHNSSVSWMTVTDFQDKSPIIALEYCMANPNIVYLSKRDGRLYRLEYFSKVVDLTANLPDSNMYVSSIETDEDNDSIVYITAYDRNSGRGLVLKSSDRGQTWLDITGSLPQEYFNYIIQDTSSRLNQLYLGTFTGVYTINDSLNDWVDFSNGLPITDVRELEIYYGGDNPAQRHIKAATYGRGTWYSPLFVENKVDLACIIPKNIDLCLDDDIPVYVINLGLDTIHSAKISVYVNGQFKDTLNWTGSLATYQVDTVYLSGILTSPGAYDTQVIIQGYGLNAADLNLVNNISSRAVDIVLERPDYTQDFANARVPRCWQLGEGWTVSDDDSLEFGAKSAYNGYLLFKKQGQGKSLSYVTTCAFDFSGYKDVYLKLEQYLKANDGLASIEYSFDKVTWHKLATFTGTRGTDKVADIYVHKITDVANQPIVYFRFGFEGSSSALWAIDDIMISNRPGQGIITEPILVYPNPASGIVNISFRESYDNAQIRLMDLQGKILLDRTVKTPQYEQINLEGLRQGIYLVEIIVSGQTTLKPIIVE